MKKLFSLVVYRCASSYAQVKPRNACGEDRPPNGSSRRRSSRAISFSLRARSDRLEDGQMAEGFEAQFEQVFAI
jgi:hypothetical protein